MEYDYVIYEWAVDIMLSVVAGRWDLILFVLFGLNRTCGITAGDTVHFKKSRRHHLMVRRSGVFLVFGIVLLFYDSVRQRVQPERVVVIVFGYEPV